MRLPSIPRGATSHRLRPLRSPTRPMLPVPENPNRLTIMVGLAILAYRNCQLSAPKSLPNRARNGGSST